MADAEFTFKATGAETVVAANKKIEQSMSRATKQTGKSGYAVLEASRALEDFSMAGMRGALNNIPQLLLNLGVGAGLTGVVGALTVVVWKGTEYLGKYLDKIRDLKLAGADVGLKLFDFDAMKLSFSDEAIKKAQDMVVVFDELARSQDTLDNLTNIYNKEKAADFELAFAREMVNLTKNRASEEQKANFELNHKIKLEEEAADMAQNTADTERNSLDKLISLKEKQQEIVARADKSELDAINKKVQLENNRQNKRLNQFTRKELVEGGVLQKRSMIFGDEIDAEDQVAIAVAAEKWANKYRYRLLDQKGVSEKIINDKIKEASIAEEKIKLLDEEIEKQKQLVEKSNDNAASAKKILEYTVETLKLENEKEDLIRDQKKAEEEQKKADAEQEAKNKAMQQQKAIDASVFLSNQGRSGLAGNEAKVAMDTLGVAKMSLDALKQIVKNTSNMGVPRYGGN